MAASKPPCQGLQTWLQSNMGRGVLGPLTGQDFRALTTFIHALELYSSSDYDGRDHALRAMHHAVAAMQVKTRWMARESIPYVLDWGDRERLWPEIVCDGKGEILEHTVGIDGYEAHCRRFR